jgi:hypothetical protein
MRLNGRCVHIVHTVHFQRQADNIWRHGCVADGAHEALEDESRRLKKRCAEERLKANFERVVLAEKW